MSVRNGGGIVAVAYQVRRRVHYGTSLSVSNSSPQDFCAYLQNIAVLADQARAPTPKSNDQVASTESTTEQAQTDQGSSTGLPP